MLAFISNFDKIRFQTKIISKIFLDGKLTYVTFNDLLRSYFIKYNCIFTMLGFI